MRPPNLAVRACTALLLFALFAPTALAAPGRPRFLGRRGSWANGGPRPPMRDEPSPHAVAPQLHQFDRRHLLPRLYPGFAFENATKVLQSAVAGEDTPYDAGTRPGFGQGATPVRAQFRVNNLYDVDPVTSTFTIDVFLRLYWNDPRLIVSPDDFPSPNGSDYRIMGSVALGGGWGPTHAIWTPDIYFANEVDPVTLDEVIKLTPYTGDVFWSRHFVVQLTNSFYLGAFPFDRQVLEMQLTSYSYNENQMAVFWQPETVYPPINPETFSQVTWDYQTYQASREKYYSRQGQPAYDLLKFQMYISRKSGSYYIKSFLPLLLLVALTAVSYWLSVEAVPERLGLSITLVLTIGGFLCGVSWW
ncbi:neurotransmitter-gated ion-channel ligand-binding domain-containing protein [Hyaloraphidium curvatum]|nr:neurotransmitter-gated ion-channel ligand-binding domain-containing protein [Hyaloraphidium curvatum]